LEEAKAILDQAQSDEESAFENMPESLQQSERGQQSETALSCLSDANDNLDSAISSAEESVST
jgi:hypothetical protein